MRLARMSRVPLGDAVDEMLCSTRSVSGSPPSRKISMSWNESHGGRTLMLKPRVGAHATFSPLNLVACTAEQHAALRDDNGRAKNLVCSWFLDLRGQQWKLAAEFGHGQGGALPHIRVGMPRPPPKSMIQCREQTALDEVQRCGNSMALEIIVRPHSEPMCWFTPASQAVL